MSDHFSVVSQPKTIEPGNYRGDIVDGWQQGRGAFGGLVIGMMARSMELEESTARSLRTITAEIPSPVMVGECAIEVRTLRRGKGLSSHTASLLQEDSTAATATAVFGDARSLTHQTVSVKPPNPPKVTESAAIPANMMPPPFSQHFEYRPTSALPFSGSSEAVTEGWVRLRNTPTEFGAAELIALADSFWPALYSVEKAPRPAATVSFFLHICAATYKQHPDAWVFCQNRVRHAQEGFCLEERAVFDEQGQLLGINTQTFVVIK